MNRLYVLVGTSKNISDGKTDLLCETHYTRKIAEDRLEWHENYYESFGGADFTGKIFAKEIDDHELEECIYEYEVEVVRTIQQRHVFSIEASNSDAAKDQAYDEAECLDWQYDADDPCYSVEDQRVYIESSTDSEC